MPRTFLRNLSLLSGFNDPEEHFVWSQYEFSMRFEDDAGFMLLLCNCATVGGELQVDDDAGRRLRYPLQLGENWVLFRCPEQAARTVRCVFTPRVQNPSDIRELGLMLRHVEACASEDAARGVAADSRRPLVMPTECAGTQGAGVGRLSPLETLYAHALRGPLERGWCKLLWSDAARADVAVISGVLYPPRFAHPSLPDRFELCVTRQDGTRFTGRFGALSASLNALGMPDGAIAAEVPIEAGAATFADVQFDIGLRDTVRGTELLPWQTGHWRGLGAGPLPGPGEIQRVAGPIGIAGFCLGGATWYTKLARVVDRYAGRALDDMQRILDWGCGCGRISRFAPDRVRRRIIGVDIDRHNIDWCRTAFPESTFLAIDPEPPIPYEAASVDLVFGHSVFTHLTEAAQDDWLAEHQRLLRPGGLCVVTAALELGWSVMLARHRNHDQLAHYLAHGIRDSGWLDVGVDASKPGYYRNTWHTTDYIASRWSRYFDILDVIDGFSDFQSLVVMRRREGSRTP